MNPAEYAALMAQDQVQRGARCSACGAAATRQITIVRSSPSRADTTVKMCDPHGDRYAWAALGRPDVERVISDPLGKEGAR